MLKIPGYSCTPRQTPRVAWSLLCTDVPGVLHHLNPFIFHLHIYFLIPGIYYRYYHYYYYYYYFYYYYYYYYFLSIYLLLLLLSIYVFTCIWRVGMAQWWDHSPPTNVAWVRFPDWASDVGRVCCWFLSLLQEAFLWFLWFSPFLKNQHFLNLIWTYWSKSHPVDQCATANSH